MSKIWVIIGLFAITFGCDSKLSEEQRKALRDEMEERKIKRIGQNDIYNKALEEGRKWADHLIPSVDLDSLTAACACEITFSEHGAGLTEKQKAVFDAYVFNPTGDDNVQKEGGEKLVYAVPVLAQDTLSGVWFIRFDKSAIVRKL